MIRSIRYLAPCLAVVAMLAACEDKDTTGVNTTASVRFVNAMSGSGSLSLAANGSVVGSPLAFPAQSSTCQTVNTSTANSMAFTFGTASSAGTTLATTLGTATSALTAGGSYTVIATGTTSNPQLYVLPATSTTTAATGNANVRFVNATGLALDAFSTTSGAVLGTATASGLSAYSAGSTFATVPITNTSLTYRIAGTTTNAFTASNIALTSGGNYTIIVAPNGTSFQTIVVSGTC